MLTGATIAVLRIYLRTFGLATVLAVGLPAGKAPAETLEEALGRVYQTNPEILAYRAEVTRAREGVVRETSRWKPSVNVRGEYLHSFEREKIDALSQTYGRNDWTVAVEASQVLYSGNRIRQSRNVSIEEVHSARFRLQNIEQAILQKTVSAYMNIIREEMVFDYFLSEIRVFEEFLAQVRNGDGGEDGKKDGEEQISAEIDSLRAGCVAQHASLLDSRRAYEELVGQLPLLTIGSGGTNGESLGGECIGLTDIGGRPRTVAGFPRAEFVIPESVDEVVHMALEASPELNEARAQLKQAEYAVKAAYAELTPKLDLAAYALTNGRLRGPEPVDHRDEAGVALNLTVPIYQGGSEWASIRSEKERQNVLRLRLTAMERRMRREAAGAWYSLKAAEAEVRLNLSRLMAQSKSFGALNKTSRSGGEDPATLDFIFQRRDLLDTRISLASSRRDEVIFKYNLLKVMGRLTPGYLKLDETLYNQAGQYSARRRSFEAGP